MRRPWFVVVALLFLVAGWAVGQSAGDHVRKTAARAAQTQTRHDVAGLKPGDPAPSDQRCGSVATP